MLKRYVSVMCLIACMLLPGVLRGQDVQEFAVAPFAIHGPDKYQYLQKGIQSMLVSRLTWEGRLRPARDGELLPISSENQAKNFRQSLGIDNIVWGEVTIVGHEADVSVHLFGGHGGTTFSRATPMPQLIPVLEDVSGQIRNAIFPQKDTKTFGKEAQNTTESQTANNSGSRINEGFVYQDQQAGQGGLNPQFEYTGYQSSTGRWRSQSLPFTGLNMVVGDGDADGENEIFVLTEHGVRAYGIEQNKLAQLGEYQGSVRIECLNLNVIDLNRDGYLELVVSAMQNERVTSFVLNFKDGSFEVVEDEIKFFMNVVRMPPEYQKTLIGQRKGKSKLFDHPVQEVIRMDGKLRLQRNISLPSRTNVFNFAYLPFKDMYKVIAVTENDRLAVFNHNHKVEHVTANAYAASAQGIPKDNSFPGLGESIEDPTRFYYIPSRLVPCNLDRNDEFELLVNRNISLAAQFFTRYRYFPQGEIHSLFWDGIGLAPQWTTRPINGTVVDYGIADINNDENQELYVCVTTHPGLTGFRERKTVVYSYVLNVEDEGETGVRTEGFYLRSGGE